MKSRGILLVNLGSPDSPSEEDVRAYLNTFLMDPCVIDLPFLLRRLLVSLFILPTRPARSAQAYQSVWTPEGSPLVTHSQKLADAIASRINAPVEIAMRYGHPSMERALEKLANTPGIQDILLFPLYPHYAMSTVKTAVDEALNIIDRKSLSLSVTTHPVFYDHEGYIDALVKCAQPWLDKPYNHLVFSFHGLPERHIRKDDPTRKHCLSSPDCCKKKSSAHATCYRHQVMKTVERFVEKTHIPVGRYTVAFQSRLGRAKWLEPTTSSVLTQLAQQGNKKVLVICPSFVADCLETLEEIGIAGRKTFMEAGGESLELIPCLNEHPAWVNQMTEWLSAYT
ncbi:Ferrochelatase [invertebrate metagenome]|uniref:Ferrochelatase n=1 Tax=invertebrate metagenome TaxID=1711999 RepID=A0A2H9T8X4_9ZZZZ